MAATSSSGAAGVEKVLFPPTAPTPSGAPAAGRAPASAALSGDGMARVSTIISDDLRQLSRDDLDVTRWLNAALARVMEAAKDASPAASRDGASTAATPSSGTAAPARKPLQLEEQLVQVLHARVQTHSQELSAGIEDLISATLVRLPRTTMELTRMATEATELTEQLQRIEAAVQPAVAAGAESHVEELQRRKTAETKLHKCKRLLEKAARVEESIRNLQYLVEHRESMGNKKESRESVSTHNSSRTATPAPSDAKTAAQQRDLDEVALIIRQARDDLKEITAVDDTFGEQYKSQLEQFEQYIEHALEEECVACLRAHQLERATRLMTTLYSIGRADAVLRNYAEQAATQMADKQREKLQACVAGNSDNKGRSTAAAAVAELLRREVIPDDSAFISRELLFLSRLVRRAQEEVQATASPVKKGEPVSDSRGPAVTPASSTPSPVVGGTAPGGAGAVSSHTAFDEDPRAVQTLEIISMMLNRLYSPVQSTLQPLLTDRPDTVNADFVACLAAIQQLKITAVDPSTAAAQTPSTSAPTAGAVSGKDRLEVLAREATHRAVALFAGLFYDERVLQRYADRVCAPVAALCARPLSELLPASVESGDLAAAGEAREEGSLAHALIHAIQEVLVYAPDKISARCTTAWHAALSAMVAQLRPDAATLTAGAAQHTLLQHLYLYKRRMRPLLLKAQQAVEDWLASGTVHERYPTSAGVLRADLQARLWGPLKKELEAAQAALQARVLDGITRPILNAVDGYGALPCWGSPRVGQAGGAAADVGGSATAVGAFAGASPPLGAYTQGQVAPSPAVRDMGEMLMELPLTLETLGSSAVADGNGRDAVVTDPETAEGVRALIEEQAEVFLEAVVRDVVRAFLEEKVLPLRIGPFGAAAPASGAAAQGAGGSRADAAQRQFAVALEQLTTDLDYVLNILSAVNEESLESVERVLRGIQALPPPASLQGTLTVGDAIHMPSLQAAAEPPAATATPAN